MKSKLRSTVAAAMMLLPAAATFVALPQSAVAAPAMPEINTLQVNSDEGVNKGADLNFAVEGTPRSRVTVTFSKITLTLKETSAGMYRGVYTVRSKDRIDPTQPIVARLTSGKRVATTNYNWPASFQQLASAPAPVVAAAPLRIDAFRMWPRERIEPGRELHYMFNAAPGLSASFEIPGVASAIPMRESAPGRYEGTYTVRQRDNPAAFDTAIATLRGGSQVATARLGNFGGPRENMGRDNGPRDNTPPQVVEMMPRPGDVISLAGPERVSAQFDDRGGRGVDPSTVRLVISGRDVTGESRITPNEVQFRGDLPPGRHTAEVTARDYAGNAVSKSWNFEVRGDRVGQGYDRGGPLSISVMSPAPNAQVDANGNLTIAGRTAPFARVTARVEAIAPLFGNVLNAAQPPVTETVQADRDGHFSVTVQPRALPIPGTRFDVSLTASHNQQTAEQRLSVFQRQG